MPDQDGTWTLVIANFGEMDSPRYEHAILRVSGAPSPRRGVAIAAVAVATAVAVIALAVAVGRRQGLWCTRSMTVKPTPDEALADVRKRLML
jgi:hypothetical protein